MLRPIPGSAHYATPVPGLYMMRRELPSGRWCDGYGGPPRGRGRAGESGMNKSPGGGQGSRAFPQSGLRHAVPSAHRAAEPDQRVATLEGLHDGELYFQHRARVFRAQLVLGVRSQPHDEAPHHGPDALPFLTLSRATSRSSSPGVQCRVVRRRRPDHRRRHDLPPAAERYRRARRSAVPTAVASAPASTCRSKKRRTRLRRHVPGSDDLRRAEAPRARRRRAACRSSCATIPPARRSWCRDGHRRSRHELWIDPDHAVEPGIACSKRARTTASRPSARLRSTWCASKRLRTGGVDFLPADEAVRPGRSRSPPSWVSAG